MLTEPQKTDTYAQPDAEFAPYPQAQATVVSAPRPFWFKLQNLLPHFSFANLPRKQIATGFAICLAVVFIAHAVSFFWPRQMAFSYAGGNCFFNPVLLPNTASVQQGKTFHVDMKPSLSVAGYPLYSATTCVTLVSAPRANTATENARIALFGIPVLAKNVSVSPGSLPSVSAVVPLDKPVAPKEPLTFGLSQTDQHFTYRLTANEKKVDCQKNGSQFSCDLDELALSQSTQYPVTVERVFNGSPVEAVLKQTITTVSALELTIASIAENQTVYSIPADITLQFNKPLGNVEGLTLTRTDGDSEQAIGVTTSLEATQLIVRFNEPLPRQATFRLTFGTVKADDGSYLASPTSHQFMTSGGPKVTGISIGSARVQPGSGFTLTFDSSIQPGQNLADFIRVDSNGNRLPADLTLRGNQVIVGPQGLNACQTFTVKVVDGLKNEAGVTGGSGWQFNSRTTCMQTFTIGTSVKGRGIVAYKFGNGPTEIVFTGGLHGNEKSSSYILQSFVSYLESNYDRIPADRSVVVIPIINPDGYAANNRTNANGIDLNRNFPANNWKSGVKMPDGSFQPQGGGASPLSEPESRAIANYIASIRPRMVLSYHAVAGIVAANEAGDSRALASKYGQKAGYPSYGNEASGHFDYDTTGAYEDWLHDKLGTPGLLIELRSYSGNEFSRHQSAMWDMVVTP